MLYISRENKLQHPFCLLLKSVGYNPILSRLYQLNDILTKGREQGKPG
jgi:hypothetical protein